MLSLVRDVRSGPIPSEEREKSYVLIKLIHREDSLYGPLQNSILENVVLTLLFIVYFLIPIFSVRV